MKILVVTQYFWPENFRINDLCVTLQERGHELTVLTGQPNYPDGKLFDSYIKDPENFNSLNGVKVLRSPIIPRKKGGINLLLNYLSFVFSASFKGAKNLRNKDFDIILVCQLSPVTSVIPAIFMKFLIKKPIVMWSLDLWPESLESVGAIKSKRALHLVGVMVSWIYKHCDVILGQSESYLNAIRKRCSSSTKLRVFPNWAEDQFKIVRTVEKRNKPFNILFAGNIGDAQDFESIVLCAKLLKLNDMNIVFSIVGSGSKYQWLKNKVSEEQLEPFFILHGRHPLEAMPKFYSEADAALVSLKSTDIFQRTIPGKMQSYMLSSLPILAMLDGEGRELIDKANCGLGCAASDETQLFENIKIMSDLPVFDLEKLGINGKNYATEFFDKEKLITLLEDILALEVKG